MCVLFESVMPFFLDSEYWIFDYFFKEKFRENCFVSGNVRSHYKRAP